MFVLMVGRKGSRMLWKEERGGVFKYGDRINNAKRLIPESTRLIFRLAWNI